MYQRITNAIDRASHAASHVVSDIRQRISPDRPVYTRPPASQDAPTTAPQRISPGAERDFQVPRQATQSLLELLAMTPRPESQPFLLGLIDSVHRSGGQYSMRELTPNRSNLLHVVATSSYGGLCEDLTTRIGRYGSGYSAFEISRACRAKNDDHHTPAQAANEAGFPLRAMQLIKLELDMTERILALRGVRSPDAAT